MAGDENTLERLRAELDAVDDELLDVLNRRARIVEQVAEYKHAAGVPFYRPDRERRIIERLTARNTGPFPNAGIRPVIQEIISACLSLEKGQRVAYLGPEGTFTHQAVTQQFGTSARAVPCGTIGGVFEEVERGGAHYGVVPVENSTEGVVSHTLDNFLDTDLRIIAEVLVPVSHCLLVRHGGTEAQVQRVYSHPQALAQCRKWLEANLPRATLVEAASTADAARACHSDPGAAAIASELAAKRYDLDILRSNVQDLATNVTRFLVVGPPGEPQPATGDDKTSVLFVVRDDPGALFAALSPLSRHNVNMSKIESRPSRRQAWEYVFFVDLDGHGESDPVKTALAEMAQACQLFKVLGTYRKAARDEQ